MSASNPATEDYAALAELAGGFIHEIKNHLNTLNLNLQLLAEDFQNPENQRERRALTRVQKLQGECERLVGLSNDFLKDKPLFKAVADFVKQYGSVLGRIEQTYGVPGEVLVAIWGLETDYGVNLGKFSTLRALASLAYDCRRSALFRAELVDALRIVERGDISPQDLRGAWAGEIGQTQFMPSNYIKYAVDFDGNGRRDLLRSVPDVLASTANFLAGKGWQRGKDWEPGSANFAVIKEWNKSEVYAKTIGYLATQLARAP